jgi:5-methylcytosine-specific restriction endonuclease McrA
MTATTVTLLNASYEPLGKVSFQQAVRMVARKVAAVEEAVEGRMAGPWPWPRVIRLLRYISPKWLYRPAGWHRGGVFIRDGHRCAYCGQRATTIDHVTPLSRGGARTDWLNTVAACGGTARSCNARKADKLPGEAGMKLRFTPYVPAWDQLHRPGA